MRLLEPAGVNASRRQRRLPVAVQALLRSIQGSRLRIVQDDVVAVGRRLEPDLQAHRAAADHENAAYVIDVHSVLPNQADMPKPLSKIRVLTSAT